MRVAERIISTSQEGKTPITRLLIASHHGGVSMTFGSSGKTKFNTKEFIDKYKAIAPSYERASQKKGPLRCWFSTESKVTFSGCNTKSSAALFAQYALRKGAQIKGTNSSIVTGKENGRRFIRAGAHEEWYFTPPEESLIWVSFNGKA